MAEFTANAVQEVAVNQNVLFTDEAVCGNNSIFHRDGSGLVFLKGLTNQCRALFKVSFGANIAIPTGGTVGEISVALSINGESIPESNMIFTPAAVDTYGNVSRTTLICVPANCCSQVSVKNTSTQAINVQNANLIVERIA